MGSVLAMGKLTAIAVKAMAKPGRYTDGDGLHLHVRQVRRADGPIIKRTWIFRYMRRGRLRDMGMGAYPDVSLAQAREALANARKLLREGQDPVDARHRGAASAPGRTFRDAAEDFITSRGPAWRNSKHAGQWAATLSTYAYPVIGGKHVQDVATEDVLRILRPIWTEKSETASRVRGRIEAVLDAAKARHWREGENPARWKGHLAALLPAARKVRQVEHHPALPWRQLNVFMPLLRGRTGGATLALEFAILTAARSGEVRGLTWAELDLDAGVWTCPPKRMKAKRVHRVPLVGRAVAILRDLHATRPAGTKASDLVFPSAKAGKPLSDMSLTAVLRRMNKVDEDETPPWRDGATGEPIVPHGFRSTFRDWAGEATAHPRELVEAALAHKIKDKAEAAYARSDLLERRRALMEEWGRACAGGAGLVLAA